MSKHWEKNHRADISPIIEKTASSSSTHLPAAVDAYRRQSEHRCSVVRCKVMAHKLTLFSDNRDIGGVKDASSAMSNVL